MIEISAITKRYGTRIAVDDATSDVATGRVTGLHRTAPAARFAPASPTSGSSSARSGRRPWSRWHHLRTIASVCTFALAAAAALVAADDG